MSVRVPLPLSSRPGVARTGPTRPGSRWAPVVVGLLLAAYLLGLLHERTGFDPLLDGVVGGLVVLVPGLACFAEARARRREARVLLLLGTGIVLYGLGNLYFVVVLWRGLPLPFPSWGDVGYLGLYPFVVAAVLAGLRERVRAVPWEVGVDALLGAAGAATGLAVLLGPLTTGAAGGHLAVAVAVAYPLADLVLAALVVGAAAVAGWRGGAGLLLAGLVLFAAGDVVYALRVAQDAYVPGTPLDAGWALGLAVLYAWARSHDGRTGRPAGVAPAAPVLAVPLLATAVAVGVLVTATLRPVAGLAVALAALTLAGVAARTHLAFLALRRLAALRQQVQTDDLTGLPNRRALHAHLHGLLAVPRPAVALLLLDLDRFKEVNDALGHHVGDQLLREIGPRLAGQLRPTDLLARLGGDEFAVVLPEPDGALEVAQRLLGALETPFACGGSRLRVAASIGIATAEEAGGDVAELLQRADVAMYAAKAGGSGAAVYDPVRDQGSRDRLQLVEELREALAAGQLVVHYQPQVHVGSDRVTAVEALVRWQHPRRGLLYPDAFLGVAAQAGLMPALARHVLHTALGQCGAWRRDGVVLGVSVNLCASDLLDRELPALVAGLLARHGVPGRALTLELTESTLMVDPAAARQTMLALRGLGVRLSVDDYGTGYCSLAYLRDLPLDELKLDRSFVMSGLDACTRAIVRSTVELGHALGLAVVAEGVEDAAALDVLRELGCDLAQGYHLGRPGPAAALQHRLGGTAGCVPAQPDAPAPQASSVPA